MLLPHPLILILLSTPHHSLTLALSTPNKSPPSPLTTTPTTTPNANHIFNTIHSSLRQWGSSLNHNGMSFFLATVPAGVRLYHGTGEKEAVKGIEWLAFEPEHALVFARPRGGGGRRPGPPPPSPPDDGEEGRDSYRIRDRDREGDRKRMNDSKHPHQRPVQAVSSWDDEKQTPLPTQPPPTTKTGYLHTYTPLRDLHLLYIDGMSAGKTPNGTLDSQDILLLNNSLSSNSTMGNELHRAQKLCELAATRWRNGIDGILRMEAGFEIIMCGFERHLALVEVMPVSPRLPPPPSTLVDKKQFSTGQWNYIKAITSRYHGLGRPSRATLDYGSFVSVFAYDTGSRDEDGSEMNMDMDMGLWKNNVLSDTMHPRLVNAKVGQLDVVRGAVDDMILSKKKEREDSRQGGGGGGERGTREEGEGKDWQAVVDLVVERYAKPLHHLHTDQRARTRKGVFYAYLDSLLRPFIATERNTTLETARCVGQFVPSLQGQTRPPPLAQSAIHAATSRICETLITAHDLTSTSLSSARTSAPPSSALRLVDELVGWLQWTTWKECGACADEEVCFVPMWPMGSLEEHASPRCKREEEVGSGYWGRWGDRERPPRGLGGRGDGQDGGRYGGQHGGHDHGHGYDRGGGVWMRVQNGVQWGVRWLRPGQEIKS